MNSTALTVFVGVARAGSLARFARQQALSPSSVSRGIDALERELGVRLFQRTTRRLAITEAGERLLRHVGPLLEQLELASEVARDAIDRPAGTLRVTAPVAFGQTVLSPLLIEFARAHPRITLDVILSDGILPLVEERIDMAIRLGKLADSTFVARSLGKLSYAVCASPDYLSIRGAPHRPEDLLQHDCLRHPIQGQRPTWRFRSTTGAASEVAVRGPLSINSGIALRDCALAGLGITMVPRWNVEHQLREGTLLELLARYEGSASDIDACVWLVLPSRRQVPANVRAFSDFLQSKLRGLSCLRAPPLRSRARPK
ncbi:MAG: transcriptional regulator [Myxococcaceae bacterium]|nr:transcriptional regulator [Myxococcaceae bacterium]